MSEEPKTMVAVAQPHSYRRCYTCDLALPCMLFGGTRYHLSDYLRLFNENCTREGRDILPQCPECRPVHVRWPMDKVRRFLDKHGRVKHDYVRQEKSWPGSTCRFLPAQLDRHGTTFQELYDIVYRWEVSGGRGHNAAAREPPNPNELHKVWSECTTGLLDHEACRLLSDASQRRQRLTADQAHHLIGACFLQIVVRGRVEVLLLLDFWGDYGFVAKSWWGVPEAHQPAYKSGIKAMAYTLMEVAELVGAPHVYLGWYKQGDPRMAWKKGFFAYSELLQPDSRGRLAWREPQPAGFALA